MNAGTSSTAFELQAPRQRAQARVWRDTLLGVPPPAKSIVNDALGPNPSRAMPTGGQIGGQPSFWGKSEASFALWANKSTSLCGANSAPVQILAGHLGQRASVMYCQRHICSPLSHSSRAAQCATTAALPHRRASDQALRRSSRLEVLSGGRARVHKPMSAVFALLRNRNGAV